MRCWWGQWHRKKLHINALKIRQYNHINKLRLFFFFSFLSLWEISNKYNLDIAHKKKSRKHFFTFSFCALVLHKFLQDTASTSKKCICTFSFDYVTCIIWNMLVVIFVPFLFLRWTWQTYSLGRKMFTF